MTKKLVATFFAVGALVAAQCAAAADLSVAPLYKAAPSLASPAYNWTGFYLGANGGGGWGRSWWQSQSTSIDLSGARIVQRSQLDKRMSNDDICLSKALSDKSQSGALMEVKD